jgi:hypothetical protein
MNALPYQIAVSYNLHDVDDMGRQDAELSRIVGAMPCDSGCLMDPGIRDLGYQFATIEEAHAAVSRLQAAGYETAKLRQK